MRRAKEKVKLKRDTERKRKMKERPTKMKFDSRFECEGKKT